MGIIRDSFVIFKNWGDAINELPDEYQLETYKALIAYGTTGEIPKDISAIAKAMLVSFSIAMESNICRYNASVENGKKGGNPNFKKGVPNPYYAGAEDKKDNLKDNLDNLALPNITQDNPEITEDNQTLPTHNLYDNVNVNDNVLNKVSKKVSKEKDNLKITTARARRSYDDILSEGVEEGFINKCVANKLLEFIKHLKLHDEVMLDSRLESLIVQLDLHYPDNGEKVKVIDKAIACGYKALEFEV